MAEAQLSRKVPVILSNYVLPDNLEGTFKANIALSLYLEQQKLPLTGSNT